MKKILKVMGLFIFSAFLLLPLKTYAAEPVWIQNLDLKDSVSSSIAKVEDGVVVMQYEGTASDNNLIIKYDFDGNKIWQLDNEYGYNIESVSDGFIVWSETKITKFDKDKNILWSKDVALEPTDANDEARSTDAGLGRKLVELDDYYIVYQVHYTNRLRNDMFCIDKNGNIVQRISINDFLAKNNMSSDDFWLRSIGYLSDNKFILMYSVKSGGTFNIAEVTNDFTITRDNEYQINLYDYDLASYNMSSISGVISTNKGYIIFGKNVIYFLDGGNFKAYSKLVLDVIKKDEYIYTYEFRGTNGEYNNMLHDAYIVKYNMDMEEQDIIRLSLSCSIMNTYSGFAELKNRFILKDENNVISLNTPILYIRNRNWDFEFERYSDNYKVEGESYSLASYRFAEEKEDVQEENKDNNNLSGVINNIVKNPQTNSIIIISVFVILVLIISIVSYLLYKKKKLDIK